MNTKIIENDIWLFNIKTNEILKLQKIYLLTKRYVLARKSIIIENKEELETLILENFNESKNMNFCLGIIPHKVIKRIKEETRNVKYRKIIELLSKSDKYTLTISQSEIKHMKKSSQTNNDIIDFTKNLDILITEFDEVSYSIYNRSKHALRFKKKINGITYITVAVISNKYQTFRIQTVYIDKDDFLKIYSKNTK